MSDKIYIIGHKSPDLDSVAAAVSYADLKNKLGGGSLYEAAVAGELNGETGYVLEKAGLAAPALMSDASGKTLVLVDHNEAMQSVDGIENAKIVEVLDHHKVDFRHSEPIMFTIVPWGASCTIIADAYFKAGVEIGKDVALLMLSAILVDTVITKSPTCTEKDKEVIEKLAKIAGVEDWKSYGMEIFKIRSNVASLPVEAIIKGDYKDFNLAAGKFGIGQVETVDLGEFSGREDEIIEALENIKQAGGYHTAILFITDIIKEGSLFLVASDDAERIGEAFGVKVENGRVYVPGIISRKKQVAPKITEIFG